MNLYRGEKHVHRQTMMFGRSVKNVFLSLCINAHQLSVSSWSNFSGSHTEGGFLWVADVMVEVDCLRDFEFNTLLFETWDSFYYIFVRSG